MSANKIKALVVDDKKIIGDMFTFVLGYSGHDITVVRTPEDAIDKVRKENFDVVFLDIVMPDRDGLSVLEEIRTIDPGLPVVIMSGYSVTEKRQQIKDLGVTTYLDKPFEIDDVRRVVKALIGKDI